MADLARVENKNKMNEIQRLTMEYWLSGVTFENSFKPNSDQRTSDYMKSIGHKVSKSVVFKWRKRFEWGKELDFRIKQLTSESQAVRNSLGETIKDEAVAKTIVDLKRNKELLGRGYEILELKCKLIMEEYKITHKLSTADTKLALDITQLVTNREDRMLDRKVVSDALGKDEALKAIAAIAGEVEFSGEDIELEGGAIIDIKVDEEDEL